MARIRNLKPEFFDSPDTADADLAVRLTFLAMWCWADDSGKGTANLKELEAFAWPNDEVAELPRRGSRSSAALWPSFGHILAEVQRCYGVVFYKVDRRPYYWIPSFKANQAKHFKPDSKLPGADEGEVWDLTCDYPDCEVGGAEVRPHSSRSSATPQPNSAALGPLDRDRDRDGDRDNYSPSSASRPTTNTYPDAFESFWSVYPRKHDKRAGLKAWEKARKRASNQELIDGARRYRDDPNREDQYTKHGATWLNADGWLDDPLPARGGPKPEGLTTRQRRFIEAELLKSNPDPRAVALAQQNGIGDGSGPDSGAAADRGGLRQSADRPADGFRVVEGGGAWALEA